MDLLDSSFLHRAPGFWIYLFCRCHVRVELQWRASPRRKALNPANRYWRSHLFTSENATATLTLAGTLQSGFLYISAIVISPACTRYPEHRALAQYLGLALSVVGIAGSAFVNKPWQLLVTIGFAYPLGASMVSRSDSTASYAVKAWSMTYVLHRSTFQPLLWSSNGSHKRGELQTA